MQPSTKHKLFNEKDFCVRLYESGDELGILKTFREVFHSNKTEKHWQWEFLKNPYAPPTLGIAKNVLGEVVGHYGTIPIALNVNGRKVLAAQSVDTFVREDYRMHGLFVHTAKKCYAQCDERGIEAVYGFPNAAAYPGRIRRLEWKQIGCLKQYILRLSLEATLKRILKFSFLAKQLNQIRKIFLTIFISLKCRLIEHRIESVTFFSMDKVPLGYDKLWSSIKDKEILSLWKDASYFNWRYDQHPINTFRYFGLTNQKEILALAVVLVNGKSAQICECLVLDRNKEWGRLLLLNLIQQFLPTHETLYFKGLDQGFNDLIFCDYRQKTISSDFFCGRVIKTNSELSKFFYSAESWNVSLGDTDSV